MQLCSIDRFLLKFLVFFCYFGLMHFTQRQFSDVEWEIIVKMGAYHVKLIL